MAESKGCILFVDDEQSIINALKREIADWAKERSLEILTSNSAYMGLKILEERGKETLIVVSDLKMPEIKGSDFLLAVKDKYPSIVTILLTGFTETEELVKAVRAGIFSYMLKPWESEYLISEMQKAYEFGETRRQNVLYMKTLEEELKWAGEMQKAILKPNLPRSDGVEFRVSYRPLAGMYCSGNYYDVIFLGTDRYLLLLGDVSGHGVTAAFVTGILKSIIYSEFIRPSLGKPFSPSEFLAWLNNRLNFEFRSASSLTVSFFAGLIDKADQSFKYANAGQSHPFILRSGEPIELIVSGSAIGYARSVMYKEQSVSLLPGDLVVLYSEGLVSFSPETGKAPVKLLPILAKTEYGADFHRRLCDAALEAGGVKAFSDDVTIVTAKIL